MRSHACISADPLVVEDYRAAVQRPDHGAIAVFCGVVRDHDDGRVVRELEYVAHPSAAEVLERMAESLSVDPAVRVAVGHRTGRLAIGDVALVAAISSAHRQRAFAALADLVEVVKAELPIWKRQRFADGTEEWVNCP